MALTAGAWAAIVGAMAIVTIYGFIDGWIDKRKSPRANGDSNTNH
jgi:hypothetical protein